MRGSLLARVAGAVVFGLGGFGLGLALERAFQSLGFGSFPSSWVLGLTLLGAVLGAMVGPGVLVAPLGRLFRWGWETPISTLAVGALGLIVGLVVGALLFPALAQLPGLAGVVTPLVVSLLLGLLGAAQMVVREREVLEALPLLRHLNRGRLEGEGVILMDTSAIIDGRIADLVQTGFVHGTLGVPRFILDELRHVADSSDALRRNRGRRGLEILHRLRSESRVPVQVLDADVRDGTEVDSRLVHLARQLKSPILTTDFNLNRVAQLQGVAVLNINELANALKPVMLPGEEMSVRVIQEGKEPGQGVAFLDDGTMVVVEGGRRYINSALDVVVTRVLQTAAGRIIFGVPRGHG